MDPTKIAENERLVVVRYDEIGLKGKNRPAFETRLLRNIARTLGLKKSAVKCRRGRVYVRADAESPIDRLARIFGIASFSPSVGVAAEPDLAAITEAAVASAEEAKATGVKTFKLEVTRADKSFPHDSYAIARQVGGVVAQRSGLAVDVHAPELVIGIEVREAGRCLVFRQRVAGPGGLPVGCTGNGLLMLSGGIDSPVAGWLAMKRGLRLDAVYFHAFPYTGDKSREKVLELARILAGWNGGGPIRVHVPAFGPVQDAIGQAVDEPFWTLALRRLMYRASDRIAIANGHGALITGECLGQVASQTLENLATVDGIAQTLVLRPLVGYDKRDIVALAERIETFATSNLPYDDCCTLFAPARPVTRARPGDVEAAVSGLDEDALVGAALRDGERFDVSPDGRIRRGEIIEHDDDAPARAEP